MNIEQVLIVLSEIEYALTCVNRLRVTDLPSVHIDEGAYWRIDHAQELAKLAEIRSFIERSMA